MLKIETKLLNERGILALAIEASSQADLKALDLLSQAFASGHTFSSGYVNSTRLIVHVVGMPEEIFKEEKNDKKD